MSDKESKGNDIKGNDSENKIQKSLSQPGSPPESQPDSQTDSDFLQFECPNCKLILDAHLLRTLRFSVVFQVDPQTKLSKQKIQLAGSVNCPKCSIVLNDFLMKSLDATLIQQEKTEPAGSTHKEFLEWEAKYEVGIEIIDKQHQKLVGLINRLHRTVTTGKREANFVKSVISELTSYTIEHLQTEEKLQIGTKFPGLEAHKKQHTEFVNAVAKLETDYHKGVVDLRPVLDFAKGWFLEHTQGSDRLFVKYLQERKAE